MSYHVRDVLESAQEPGPAPRTSTDDIIARAGRMRARRTAGVITGSAVACLAVVVTAVAGLGGLGGSPSTTADQAAEAPQTSQLTLPDQFKTVFGEYHVGPWQIGPVSAVTAGYQELPVYRDGETWQNDAGTKYPLTEAKITFYRAGVFDPDKFGVKTPIPAASTAAIENAQEKYGQTYQVTVAGRPGLGSDLWYPSRQAVGTEFTPPTKNDGYVRTTLAWQYEPGAWATYVPDMIRRSDSRQDAIKLAEAVTPQQEKQLRVPYKLGFFPEGWQTASVIDNPAEISDAVSGVFLHKGAIPEADQARPVDGGVPGMVRIVVIKGHPNDSHKGDPIDKKFRGTKCETDVPACKVIMDGYFIDLDGWDTGLSTADIHKIAEELQPVNVADRDAWVPVTR
ncbi:MAG: hypothetical protein ABW000_01590 [Actinoplanes sp.]